MSRRSGRIRERCQAPRARLAVGGPFNTPDRATSFGGDHRGYTDYPALG
ncbi:hypothetical protein [Streptomyces sp. enrichment culture]